AGLPRSRRGTPLGTSWVLGMLLPPLCLALSLDLGQGTDAADLLPLSLTGIVFVVLYSLAANRARERTPGPGAYAWAWLATVPLPCVLLFVHLQGALPAASRGEAMPLASWVSGVSPLALIHSLTAGHEVSSVAWLLSGFLAAVLMAISNLGQVHQPIEKPREEQAE
ncbi:MAG: hypothetical protein ACI9K5_002720, partial [Gammaproteobacteria bacterium]